MASTSAIAAGQERVLLTFDGVRLDVVPRIYLANVFACPVNVLTAARAVKVAATVDADVVVPKGHEATVTATLLSSAGARLASAGTTLTVTAAGTHTVDLTIGEIGAVSYWSKPGKTGTATVTATHHTLGRASVAVTASRSRAAHDHGSSIMAGGR
jgi:hypothetical protein